jgi:hypothetical protein
MTNTVPVLALLLVFGAPYAAIFVLSVIQGRRLAAVEKQLAELTEALRERGGAG